MASPMVSLELKDLIGLVLLVGSNIAWAVTLRASINTVSRKCELSHKVLFADNGTLNVVDKQTCALNLERQAKRHARLERVDRNVVKIMAHLNIPESGEFEEED